MQRSAEAPQFVVSKYGRTYGVSVSTRLVGSPALLSRDRIIIFQRRAR
jgi:hypothetical protein